MSEQTCPATQTACLYFALLIVAAITAFAVGLGMPYFKWIRSLNVRNHLLAVYSQLEAGISAELEYGKLQDHVARNIREHWGEIEPTARGNWVVWKHGAWINEPQENARKRSLSEIPILLVLIDRATGLSTGELEEDAIVLTHRDGSRFSDVDGDERVFALFADGYVREMTARDFSEGIASGGKPAW
ncbi:hypothetical protein [Caulifigura coniformis]|nr:hypothetical protein [Caulifigura coniformis]